jgi:hypothetical protein
MKVVYLVEGHNFHVYWHFKFEVEKLEKLVAKAGFTVQKDRLTFKVGHSLSRNLWRKTPIDFLKIVEGSLISNFHVHAWSSSIQKFGEF